MPHLIFVAWNKLYHSWSEKHLIHTSCALWLFKSLNNLFFLHCNRYFWRKTSTLASEKCDSMEWLFHDPFCLMLYWFVFELLLFLLGRKWYIYPYFPGIFIQFSKTVITVKNEPNWILSQPAELEFKNFKWFFQLLFMQQTFLEQSCHLHILVSAFGIFSFQSKYWYCLLASLFSHFNFDVSIFLASLLPCFLFCLVSAGF